MRQTIAAIAVLATGTVFAADPGPTDWPQWRGPDRTGLSRESGLLKSWPADGPKQLWKITGLGDGYSTPSVNAGRIYLLGTKGNDEYMICLDDKDGNHIWDVKVGQMAGDRKAPRSTPTVHKGLAYAISSDGNLVCVEIGKGQVKWQKNFKREFGGQSGGWAYTESPLVDGDQVIGTPGGDKAAIVAFKSASGDEVWRTPISGLTRKPAGEKQRRSGGNYSRAGYSSAVVAEIGGTKQYVQFLDGGVVGVDAKDGKLLWHYEEPANGTANCSTPIVRGDLVFAASGYNNGGGQAKIVKDGDRFKAEPQYFVSEFQNHHGGMVLVKDHLYGTNSGRLLCVEFKTGKVAWQDRSVGKGSITYADGHLYVRGENGKVAIVEANPDKYVENGRFDQPDRSKQAAWPHPVVANGKLYLRDWDILLCYDVKNK